MIATYQSMKPIKQIQEINEKVKKRRKQTKERRRPEIGIEYCKIIPRLSKKLKWFWGIFSKFTNSNNLTISPPKNKIN